MNLESVKNSAVNFALAKTNVVIGAGASVSDAKSVDAVKDAKQPNILHDYSSYAYNFTLSVLDSYENNTASYKRTITKGPFLAVSANYDPDNRVETAYGKFDFFIDNVKIKHLIGFEKTTANTNAITISFKIIEPYSMGMFFQAIQTDARSKNYSNYLEAPLLLTISFKGHRSPDKQSETIGNMKHIPLKMMMMDMKVSGRGSEYEISAYPVNEQAFEQSVSRFVGEVAITGTTVEEILKTHAERSLEVAVNGVAADRKEDKAVHQRDFITIEFPDQAFDKVNPIGKSKMVFSPDHIGVAPFSKYNLVYDTNSGIYQRGNLKINPRESLFMFAQGTDIINAINQVILMSEYGIRSLEQIGSDGTIQWWRIEPEVKYVLTDANLNRTGASVKNYIFRIVPYTVDTSFFLAVNEKRKGTELDKLQVVKKYDYVFTGNNLDILSFEVNFKTGFYKAIMADSGKTTESKTLGNQVNAEVQAGEAPPKDHSLVVDGKAVINNREVPTSQKYSKIQTPGYTAGGSGYDTDKTFAVKQLHDAITTNVDMVSLNCTILGDPYYISDSGMGNYHAAASDVSKYLNADGGMSWDTGEVHIIVDFITPVDINQTTGLYDFGKSVKVTQFSGLYKVLTVESDFSNGKFIQVLSLVRLPNQEAEQGIGKLAVSTTSQQVENVQPSPAVAELRRADNALDSATVSTNPSDAVVSAYGPANNLQFSNNVSRTLTNYGVY